MWVTRILHAIRKRSSIECTHIADWRPRPEKRHRLPPKGWKRPPAPCRSASRSINVGSMHGSGTPPTSVRCNGNWVRRGSWDNAMHGIAPAGADELRQRAEWHASQGRLKEAAACFEQLLNGRPGDPALLLQLSYIDSMAGGYRKARDYAMQAYA